MRRVPAGRAGVAERASGHVPGGRDEEGDRQLLVRCGKMILAHGHKGRQTGDHGSQAGVGSGLSYDVADSTIESLLLPRFAALPSPCAVLLWGYLVERESGRLRAPRRDGRIIFHVSQGSLWSGRGTREGLSNEPRVAVVSGCCSILADLAGIMRLMLNA